MACKRYLEAPSQVHIGGPSQEASANEDHQGQNTSGPLQRFGARGVDVNDRIIQVVTRYDMGCPSILLVIFVNALLCQHNLHVHCPEGGLMIAPSGFKSLKNLKLSLLRKRLGAPQFPRPPASRIRGRSCFIFPFWVRTALFEGSHG